MKFLCLDVGEKRIGVATADTAVKIAVPHSVIFVDGSEFEQITKAYRLEKANLLVVGLPRNSKGEETAQSQAVRTFIIALEGYFVNSGLEKPKVYFQDESLTSVLAEQNLNSKKRRNLQKGDIDREAATLILQDFIEAFRPDATSEAGQSDQKIDQPNPETQTELTKKKPQKVKSIVFKIFSFFVALIVLTSIGLVAAYSYYSEPVFSAKDCAVDDVPAACTEVEFNIEAGESTEQIAKRLEDQQLIRSHLVFRAHLILKGQGDKIKAGTHRLSGTLPLVEVIRSLARDPSAETFRLTLLPGETLRDIRAKFSKLGFSDAAIDAAFTKQYNHPLLKDKPSDASLEGYIYGETYEFYKTATPEEILIKTFDHFYKIIQDNNLETKFTAQNLNLHQAITLASVIQREAYSPDQPQVAQVFLLRLQKGMVLGSDAIIGYAADQIDPDRDKNDMSYLETIQCPWNSRRCPGFPPTPIASPSKSAILAVANPASGDYLYFLTGDDNKNYYAHTEAGHQQNIKNHCKKMCQIL